MEDDFGDETELEIIIAKGEDEAEDFGTTDRFYWHPAKWLNPPRPVLVDWRAINLATRTNLHFSGEVLDD